MRATTKGGSRGFTIFNVDGTVDVRLRRQLRAPRDRARPLSRRIAPTPRASSRKASRSRTFGGETLIFVGAERASTRRASTATPAPAARRVSPGAADRHRAGRPRRHPGARPARHRERERPRSTTAARAHVTIYAAATRAPAYPTSPRRRAARSRSGGARCPAWRPIRRRRQALRRDRQHLGAEPASSRSTRRRRRR